MFMFKAVHWAKKHSVRNRLVRDAVLAVLQSTGCASAGNVDRSAGTLGDSAPPPPSLSLTWHRFVNTCFHSPVAYMLNVSLPTFLSIWFVLLTITGNWNRNHISRCCEFMWKVSSVKSMHRKGIWNVDFCIGNCFVLFSFLHEHSETFSQKIIR